ncbi:MAG TPA: tetratricopeptide repeat protein [Caulobacteraceae bacterium]|jgi:tetratricopeptide (TPR) repeat protein|nr:tetratricopeptide repeat protein [Caulobacteraceae bacterium]
MRKLFLLVLTPAILIGSGAQAAVSVFGGGFAQKCYEAAKYGRIDDTSVGLCDTALLSEPLNQADRGGTYVNRGVMRLRRHELALAQADLEQGVSLNPHAGDGWLDRGAAYLAQHRWQEGLENINKALELGVSEPEKAYFNRAIAEEGLDDEKAAYFDYQHALQIKPDWQAPQHELLRFTVVQQ